MADPEDGTLRLPGNRFFRWSPGGIGEHILLTDDDLFLKHAKWTKPSLEPKNSQSLDSPTIINEPEIPHGAAAQRGDAASERENLESEEIEPPT